MFTHGSLHTKKVVKPNAYIIQTKKNSPAKVLLKLRNKWGMLVLHRPRPGNDVGHNPLQLLLLSAVVGVFVVNDVVRVVDNKIV